MKLCLAKGIVQENKMMMYFFSRTFSIERGYI